MTAVPILLYHSIAPEASSEYRPWCVHPDDFDAHLTLIDELGMHAMTVSDFADARDADMLPARPCLVTFDDGRRDFAEHAVPILEAHQIPSTMYVVTDHIGGASSWLPIEAERDQPMMSWDEVRCVAGAGVEIGAHSRSHAELDVLDRDACLDEIVGSRSRLTAELGAAVRSFAYPHGYHSRSVVDAVRAAGFDSACAVNDRWCLPGDDRFALSRQFVWNTTTTDDLRVMLLAAPRTSGPVPACRSIARRTARIGWRAARRVRHRVEAGTR
jgi:peptidoglycan/xylan/chitin deacetylase (PgdA/CDA1 family)